MKKIVTFLIGLFFFLNGNTQSLVKIEYFIDIDPGFGNGINIPFTVDSNITNLAFNADISILNIGYHTLYIRSKNISGEWSLTNKQSIYKFPSSSITSLPNITQIEYYFDTDPGFGNGVNISLSPNSDISSLAFQADISALNIGLHILNVRSKEANGHWSLTNQQFIYKFPQDSLGEKANLTEIEYFIDIDPGFGNGIGLPCNTDSAISNLAFNIDTTGLDFGTHTLNIRSRDSTGKWSLTNVVLFTRDHMKLFIQGFYTANAKMASVLQNQGVSSDSSVTDSIDLELRYPFPPYNLAAARKVILKNDGTLFTTFLNVFGSYYLVIKHRNAVETWSKNPVSIGTFPMTYNFITSSAQAYGNNMIEVESGIWAFYSGDINHDENIDLLDLSALETEINAFQYGYNVSDINGDGNVDLLDSPILETNINNFVFSSHP